MMLLVSTRVICVSGLGGVAEEWERVAPALARHGEFRALQFPATAPRSTPSEGAVHAGRTILRRVLDDDRSPAILVGHSMGGVVAMLTAATDPDRVIGLVLSSPFLPLGRHGRSTLASVTDYARHRLLFIAGANRRRPVAPPPAMSLRERAAGLRSLAGYGLRPATFHAHASHVRCPTLLVHGSGDHYVPPAFALAAAARHPAWQLRMLENAGHFPHRDNPVAWLAAVEPWLEYQATARPS